MRLRKEKAEKEIKLTRKERINELLRNMDCTITIIHVYDENEDHAFMSVDVEMIQIRVERKTLINKLDYFEVADPEKQIKVSDIDKVFRQRLSAIMDVVNDRIS
jgi:hypothetical protein